MFKKLILKNFLSVGNKQQEILLNKGLNLLSGINGAGKCCRDDTFINIEIEDDEFREIFLKFLEEENE